MNYFLNIFSGGDWSVFFRETINQFSYYPFIWSSTNGNGFGQNISFILGFKYYFALAAKLLSVNLNLPWSIVEKFLFFIPFWILITFSSYFLSAQFFKSKLLRIISVLVFCLNTYTLMLVGGGQMGVALSYAFAPLSFGFFIRALNKEKISNFLVLGIILGLQIIFDPRIALIIFLLIVFYSIYLFIFKEMKKVFIFKSLISLVLAVLLNTFWIFPFFLVKENSLSAAYTSAGMVDYLSFASMENTISLLHPNWPENVFGKVSFMKPEFLLVPLFAFLGLLNFSFFKRKQKIWIIFFLLTLISGSFLSKGTNEPFGGFYYFLSDNIPSFTMFRDPTKFYLLIVLSYSILIPFSVQAIIDRKKINKLVPFLIFILVWFALVHQLFLGQLSGTFKAKEIPEDYLKLEKLIIEDHSFYRTLWIPTVQRYGYFSATNPSVSSTEFYNFFETGKVIKAITKSENQLKERSIKYLIVPFDSEKEIFLKDRKYSEVEYKKTLHAISEIEWLKQVKGFEKIGVFQVEDPKNHFWIKGSGDIEFNAKTPVKYELKLNGVNKGDSLIFSESFDPNWIFLDKGSEIKSQKFNQMLNSFIIQRSGSYSVMVYYKPQDLVNYGLIISGLSLASILVLLFYSKLKKW